MGPGKRSNSVSNKGRLQIQIVLSNKASNSGANKLFSEVASRQITLSELLESQYVRGAYRQVSRRTFVRELARLADAWFIKFTPGAGGIEPGVELDFGAVAKYPAG